MTSQGFAELIARAAARHDGINPRIVAAQAVLESNGGRSQLAREARNVFGVKAGRSWDGPTLELPTREWSAERGWYDTTARWRRYGSVPEAVADYARIINSLPWYADAVEVAHDARAYLEALVNGGEPGWATDPTYADKVWSIAQALELPSSPPRGDADVLLLNHLRRSDRWRLIVSLARDAVPKLRVPVFFSRRPLAEGDGHKLDVSRRA